MERLLNPKVDDWNPERGYSYNAPFDVFPYRSPGPGSHLGLTLVLDVDLDSYYCSSSNSAGLKILLHNPAETPEMSNFAYMLSPGKEVRIVFKPIINDATTTLRNIDVNKRHCYFTDERYLTYYRTYTKVNCKLECLINVTIKRCGCIPYYLPNVESTKVCNKLQEECSDHIKEMMEQNELSTSDQRNMVVVHIYFVSTQFSRYTKHELYGFSEFLSNTGGILGLFLGFSCLTLIEMLYYISLRVICNTLREKRNRKTNKRSRQFK